MEMERSKPENKVWIVNTTESVYDTINMKLQKHLTFKPGVPLQLPQSIALSYLNQHGLELCRNVEKYFVNTVLKHLIIRDAGIGDLIMLEPIIRKLSMSFKREVSVACMYPQVFEFNPYIKKIFNMLRKEAEFNYADFDTWDDLRNYSETHSDRAKTHRTDIYNTVFNLELTDEEKQPWLFFGDNEKSKITKENGKIYVGLQCDASHKYRRYDKGVELINYLQKKDKKIVVVILGSYDFIKASDLEKVHDNKRVIDLQYKNTIRDAICVIRELDYFIGVDSGLMHVAMSLHVPTVAMFSIITPIYRTKYYKGHYRIIWKDLSCKGCGDYHMVRCQHEIKTDNFLAPCMDISPEEIYNKLIEMPLNEKKRFTTTQINHELSIVGDNGNKTIMQKKVNIITKPIMNKLVMPIIVQNESKNLPRFIELVMKHPAIGKVIAIDGGSTDNTVELLRSAGACVYVHAYDRNYHDMQAMQRNYSCSFVKDGEKVFIMDIDECFSKELSEYLEVLAESQIDYAEISRRTFKFYNDINDPIKQIKHYPDWQPRYFTWHRKMKWIGSPHHAIWNVPPSVKIQKDIIHFEEEGKDRKALEKQWAEMQVKTKEIYK